MIFPTRGGIRPIRRESILRRGILRLQRRRAMQFLFQKFARPEMRLSPGRYINNLAGSGISCGWFGTRLLDLKYPESPNLDSLGFYQTVTHSFEYRIHHVARKILLTARLATDCHGEFFFCGRPQSNTSRVTLPFVNPIY